MSGANDERGDRGSWWRSGVLYQLYPRSFADSNGDGHGDLEGIIEHLDHLAWLGVDGIWLNPINPSPNADWGYDVADYTGVASGLRGPGRRSTGWSPEAGERDIRVILDLVPEPHERPASVVPRRAIEQDRPSSRLVRVGRRAAGRSPPNNWVSVFGGSRVDVGRDRRSSTTCTTSWPSSPT